MKLFPGTRWGAVRLAVLLGLALLAFPPRWWMAEAREDWAFAVTNRVRDRAGLLSLREEWTLERFLQRMEDESGVDIRFLLVPEVKGESLEEYGVRMARALGVGRDADRRGMLFVYDVSSRRLRLEVGARMEPIITDAFAGYLMREHARSFLGSGNAELGIRTTLLLVQQRLREAVLGQDYDPRGVTYIADVRRLAVGGGASASMRPSAIEAAFLNTERTSDREVRTYFAPQPTPDLAYRRYLEWMARGRYEMDLPLFTPLSQEFMAGQPMTRAFNDYLLTIEYGQAYRIDERGDLALLYFTATPLVGPHFLRRTGAGWTIDIWTEVLDTRNYAGGWYTWGLLNTGDEFAQRFGDRYVRTGGIVRVAGGDNRPLPSRAFPDIKGEPAPNPADSVAQLTVEAAAAEIGSGKPSALVAGLEVRAFAMPAGATETWLLPERLRQVRAPFPPRQLVPWPSGHLSRAMAPLGIKVGMEWSPPLLAVRTAGAGTVAQIEGLGALAGGAESIRSACLQAATR